MKVDEADVDPSEVTVQIEENESSGEVDTPPSDERPTDTPSDSPPVKAATGRHAMPCQIG